MRKVLILGFAVFLILPLSAQKKEKKIDWLTVSYDKFTDKTNITENKDIFDEGVKEGKKKWEGVNIWERPGFDFLVQGIGQECSDPMFALVFRSKSSSWKYLECNSVLCLIDGEKLDLPESRHDGKVLDSANVVEYISVFSDKATFEKLWNAKQVEFKVCNDEFSLSPIEMRMLQELKNYLSPKAEEGQETTRVPIQGTKPEVIGLNSPPTKPDESKSVAFVIMENNWGKSSAEINEALRISQGIELSPERGLSIEESAINGLQKYNAFKFEFEGFYFCLSSEFLDDKLAKITLVDIYQIGRNNIAELMQKMITRYGNDFTKSPSEENHRIWKLADGSDVELFIFSDGEKVAIGFKSPVYDKEIASRRGRVIKK
jgi:hypothetical protein